MRFDLTGFINLERFHTFISELYSGAFDTKQYNKKSQFTYVNENAQDFKRMASLLQLPYDFTHYIEHMMYVNNVPSDMFKAVNNPVGSDVIILVQDRSIFCHRVNYIVYSLS